MHRSMESGDNLVLLVGSDVLNTSSVSLKPAASPEIVAGQFVLTPNTPGMHPIIDLSSRANVMVRVGMWQMILAGLSLGTFEACAWSGMQPMSGT